MVGHIVILGLMGAGKTTLGRALAMHFGRPLSDSDAWLELTMGQTARQLRDGQGVDALHHLEAQHLLAALREPTPTVICAAASAIEDEACQQALADPALAKIWLRGSPSLLADRFGSSEHRPAYGADPAAFLEAQRLRRESLFRNAQPTVIDIDGKGPEQVLAEALTALTSEPRR